MAGVRRTPPPLALRANADRWFDALSAGKKAGACKRRIRFAAMRIAAWIEMEMTESLLYPLLFTPIFQYRLWGGRRLGDWLDTSLPGNLTRGAHCHHALLLSTKHRTEKEYRGQIKIWPRY